VPADSSVVASTASTRNAVRDGLIAGPSSPSIKTTPAVPPVQPEEGLQAATAGPFDVLLVNRTDRFRRCVADVLDLIAILETASVRFSSATSQSTPGEIIQTCAPGSTPVPSPPIGCRTGSNFEAVKAGRLTGPLGRLLW
jgi:hypothetical protein